MRYRSAKDIELFIEALTLLHISKLMILFIPFRKIATRLGNSNEIQMQINLDIDVVKSLHVSILRAAKITIYSSKCFDQALTARWMLGRRGMPSTIYFGLAKDGDMLKAHAWVKSGDFVVTGKPCMREYTVVASYTNQTEAR